MTGGLNQALGTKMPMDLRIKTSFALVTILIGILMNADIVSSLDLVDVLFPPWFAAPAFVVAYLLAPSVSKKMPFK